MEDELRLTDCTHCGTVDTDLTEVTVDLDGVRRTTEWLCACCNEEWTHGRLMLG